MIKWVNKQLDSWRKIWARFESWVHSWAPGVKTKLVAGIGALGGVVLELQEFVSGLPIEQIITGKNLVFFTTGMFVLCFWFKRLSDKYSS